MHVKRHAFREYDLKRLDMSSVISCFMRQFRFSIETSSPTSSSVSISSGITRMITSVPPSKAMELSTTLKNSSGWLIAILKMNHHFIIECYWAKIGTCFVVLPCKQFRVSGPKWVLGSLLSIHDERIFPNTSRFHIKLLWFVDEDLFEFCHRWGFKHIADQGWIINGAESGIR